MTGVIAVPDCPAWCTERNGHPWDSETEDGGRTRIHSMDASSAASIYQEEQLGPDGAISFGRPYIGQWFGGMPADDELDPAAARKHAHELLAAADRLEAMVGQSAARPE